MALRRKVLRRVLYFLKKGISPHKLALSVSIGITIGIIPIYGITSILITLIAVCFRLNFTASQVANFVVHPIQIVLIFPFLKLGDMILGNSLLPDSMKQFLFMMKTDVWGTLHNFWLAYLTATVLWFLVSIPLSILLYRFLFTYFKRLIPVRVK